MPVITHDPVNRETSQRALHDLETDVDDLYVRSHFPAPRIAADAWELKLAGEIEGAPPVTLATIARLPQREVRAVLECAGNGRTHFRPMPTGTPWEDGAVACARFGGVALVDALNGARFPEGTKELVFRGADEGAEAGRHIAYERSMTLAAALHPETMLCTTMNGAPLALDHGAPVRLFVPGWYGMASVKWLAEVRATREPFAGYYQAEDYLYKPSGARVERIRVKAIVHEPEAPRVGEPTRLTGYAWSGDAPIARVDVSADSGKTWHAATLGAQDGRYAWRPWSLAWTPKKAGVAVVLARAKDEAGHEQPWQPEWNALGYGWNAIPARRINVLP